MGRLGQIMRAGGIGATGTALHYAVMAALLPFGAPVVAATAAGSIAGAALNYVLSRRWVFDSTEPHRLALPKFFATAALGLGLNALIVFAGVQGAGWPVWLVQAGATLTVFSASFVINKVWTFRERTGSQP